MYILLFISAVLPMTSAYVNCKLACQHCNKNLDADPQILEVYCAMCKECKDRRRERLHMPHVPDMEKALENLTELQHDNKRFDKKSMPRKPPEFHNRVKQTHEECPTPPPCESSEEYVKLKETTTFTTTTEHIPTSPTTTTQRAKCPSITNACRKKKTSTPCMPCIPMCATPCNPAATTPLPLQTKPSATSDYYYVYIGVPKNLIQHK